MNKTTVFISFKNTDNNIQTPDSLIAKELYDALTSQRISAFYSNVTLIEQGNSNFKETIENALDDSSILIVIGSSPEYINSKWVKYEWSSFHEAILSDAKPKGIIIPYLSERISRAEKPFALRSFETFLIERDSVGDVVSFVANYLSQNNLDFENNELSVYDKGISSHSSYRATSNSEFYYLKTLARLTRNTDIPVLSELTGKFKDNEKIYLLDIGCASGITIRDRLRLIDDERIYVLGIDRDAEIINEAKKATLDKRIHYTTIPVESDGFEDALREYMDKNGIPSFNIISSTLLLRHLKDPELAISRLKGFLCDGGYLFIREQDDGSVISYGDNGLVGKIIDKHLSFPGISDHFYARKVYSQLVNSGFLTIETRHVLRDTTDKTEEEKLAMFYAHFIKRKNYGEYISYENADDKALADAVNWISVAIDKLYEKFMDKSFYFSETDFVFLAKNEL